jgi:NADH-quinone oxidoreductase subunit N
VVFRATLIGGLGWLAVVMAVNTVIGLAYYLWLATGLFRAPAPVAVALEEPDWQRTGPGGPTRLVPTVALAVGVAVAVTVVLGFVPQLALGAVP